MLAFAGHLLALALSRPGATQRHAGHGGSLWSQRITHVPFAQALRNWVAAPLFEEFLFRGCLLSFLLASGALPARCVALSPAIFAACHLHHLHDLVRFQVMPGCGNAGVARRALAKGFRAGPWQCSCAQWQ